MNNEPVAWLLERHRGEYSFIKSKAIKEHYESKGVELIPLYMHSASYCSSESRKAQEK